MKYSINVCESGQASSKSFVERDVNNVWCSGTKTSNLNGICVIKLWFYENITGVGFVFLLWQLVTYDIHSRIIPGFCQRLSWQVWLLLDSYYFILSLSLCITRYHVISFYNDICLIVIERDAVVAGYTQRQAENQVMWVDESEDTSLMWL
jgi:hypothetical protein